MYIYFSFWSISSKSFTFLQGLLSFFYQGFMWFCMTQESSLPAPRAEETTLPHLSATKTTEFYPSFFYTSQIFMLLDFFVPRNPIFIFSLPPSDVAFYSEALPWRITRATRSTLRAARRRILSCARMTADDLVLVGRGWKSVFVKKNGGLCVSWSASYQTLGTSVSQRYILFSVNFFYGPFL